jgi:predicted metal-dependent phosphoesterase TrpH
LLKVDLHTHTREDREDDIAYSARELIREASLRGYDALAITNHNTLTHSADLESYAAEHGIVLIPGVEVTIHKKHVLLLNMPYEDGGYRTFEDISRHKSAHTLVMAPHPCFPGPTCLNGQLEANPGLFDAVEYCHFYTDHCNFNDPARLFARKHGLPLVANSDAHVLDQFGLAYSRVEAEKTPEAIIQAIKAGRVEPVSRPLPLPHLMRIYVRIAFVKRFSWQRPFEMTHTATALLRWILKRRP